MRIAACIALGWLSVYSFAQALGQFLEPRCPWCDGSLYAWSGKKALCKDDNCGWVTGKRRKP